MTFQYRCIQLEQYINSLGYIIRESSCYAIVPETREILIPNQNVNYRLRFFGLLHEAGHILESPYTIPLRSKAQAAFYIINSELMAWHTGYTIAQTQCACTESELLGYWEHAADCINSYIQFTASTSKAELVRIARSYRNLTQTL